MIITASGARALVRAIHEEDVATYRARLDAKYQTQFFDWSKVEGPGEGVQVPLTLNWGPVVGTATLHDDGTVTGEITDPDVAATITAGVIGNLSIGVEPTDIDRVNVDTEHVEVSPLDSENRQRFRDALIRDAERR